MDNALENSDPQPIVETVAKKVDLMGMSLIELESYFKSIGEKPFRASQMLQWIHQKGISSFDEMTNLSKGLREFLNEHCEVKTLGVKTSQISKDGTRKWLLDVDSGNGIEVVYIPEGTRATLCISSQVGCTLNCSFCYTAKQGYHRDLTASEIIGQLWHVVHSLRQDPTVQKYDDRIITNVVMMGMGEPLMNYDNVLSAMRIMRDDFGYCLSKKRVTLSTSGVVPRIDQLSTDIDVSLAVSVHAPTNDLRDELVPLNKKYPLEELIPALKRFVAHDPRRFITVEYVMIENVNDSVKQARQLITLLQGLPSKVNLIPFNPFAGTHYKRSSPEAIEAFRSKLMKAGIFCFPRKTRGDDIDAACGQLAGSVQDKTKRQERWHKTKLVPTEITIALN